MYFDQIMKNKYTGKHAGYGFINFASDDHAVVLMHKLNGKRMPYTKPAKLFKLNHHSWGRTNNESSPEDNISIWVGELTGDVDDYKLYKFFLQRFSSVKSARVMLKENGETKGKKPKTKLH